MSHELFPNDWAEERKHFFRQGLSRGSSESSLTDISRTEEMYSPKLSRVALFQNAMKLGKLNSDANLHSHSNNFGDDDYEQLNSKEKISVFKFLSETGTRPLGIKKDTDKHLDVQALSPASIHSPKKKGKFGKLYKFKW